MLSSVIIRSAVAEDMEDVLRLINELATYEKANHEVINTVDQLINDGFGENPVFKCNVAEVDGKVVGFTLWYISYSTWKGRCLYLEDFIVTEEYRGKGVGKLLFEALHKKAIEMNASRFEWQVLDWNLPAIAFYKKYKAEMDSTWINCKLTLVTQ